MEWIHLEGAETPKFPNFFWENYSLKFSFFTSAADFCVLANLLEGPAWDSWVAAFTFPIWFQSDSAQNSLTHTHTHVEPAHLGITQHQKLLFLCCFSQCFTFPSTNRIKRETWKNEHFSDFSWFSCFSVLRMLTPCPPIPPLTSHIMMLEYGCLERNRVSMRKVRLRVRTTMGSIVRTWG